MTVLGLITARGGSKGVPCKNVLPLHGKAVITWTIDSALGAQSVGRVVVSTDDHEIADVCRRAGADVPFTRPASLAQDESGHMDVVVHAIEWLAQHEGYHPDYVMLLQPTSPLRTSEDIDAAWDVATKHAADSVISVCETHHHPYMIKRISTEGTLVDFVHGAAPAGASHRRRQELPPAYFENGAIYLTRTSILVEQKTFCPVRTFPYIMPPDRSLQIDTGWDLKLVEYIMANR
jgi:CMP-N,N'-diacetyllegionaminic acid synthase